jgi:hypothetical protein
MSRPQSPVGGQTESYRFVRLISIKKRARQRRFSGAGSSVDSSRLFDLWVLIGLNNEPYSCRLLIH